MGAFHSLRNPPALVTETADFLLSFSLSINDLMSLWIMSLFIPLFLFFCDLLLLFLQFLFHFFFLQARGSRWELGCWVVSTKNSGKSFDILVTVVLKTLANEMFEGTWVNQVVATPSSPSYHFTEVSVTIKSSKEANMCSVSAGPTIMDQLQLKTSIV